MEIAERVQKLQKAERAKGGVLDMETEEHHLTDYAALTARTEAAVDHFHTATPLSFAETYSP